MFPCDEIARLTEERRTGNSRGAPFHQQVLHQSRYRWSRQAVRWKCARNWLQTYFTQIVLSFGTLSSVTQCSVRSYSEMNRSEEKMTVKSVCSRKRNPRIPPAIACKVRAWASRSPRIFIFDMSANYSRKREKEREREGMGKEWRIQFGK